MIVIRKHSIGYQEPDVITHVEKLEDYPHAIVSREEGYENPGSPDPGKWGEWIMFDDGAGTHITND